jgi:hypothetical protein
MFRRSSGSSDEVLRSEVSTFLQSSTVLEIIASKEKIHLCEQRGNVGPNKLSPGPNKLSGEKGDCTE